MVSLFNRIRGRAESGVHDFDATPFSSLASSGIEKGRRIKDQVVQTLQQIRSTSTDAVLNIGQLVAKIVEIATKDNDEIRGTLDQIVGEQQENAESQASVTEIIREQSELVTEFVADTKGFFRDQVAFTDQAVDGFDRITTCADSVSRLMSRSFMLALNMRIEASRLGDEGSAFAVIADEMKKFAADVRDANEEIKTVMEELARTMPRMQEQTAEMDVRVGQFSERFEGRLEHVQEHTQNIAASMQATLDTAEQRNNEIVKYSQDALSELQFQDPMAQTLARVEYEVEKMQTLLETGDCEETSLADLSETVGNDGTEFRESGEVELF